MTRYMLTTWNQRDVMFVLMTSILYWTLTLTLLIFATFASSAQLTSPPPLRDRDNNEKGNVLRQKPMQYMQLHSSSSSSESDSRMTEASDSQTMSFADCTCYFFNQPLDHFATGAHSTNSNGNELNMTLNQRYCVYDGYDESPFEPPSQSQSQPQSQHNSDSNTPIFFYTGNESPVETYANHTGLMWTLAPKYKALLIFAEHRYEGQSLPTVIQQNDKDQNNDNDHNDDDNGLDFPNCMSYVSSSQALADYAQLLSYLNPGNQRPVIVFGGSYGGMLSAWMRMKYPTSVAGAIASSAPIWGTPLTRPMMDSAYVAVSRGVLVSDAEDKHKNKNKNELELELELDDKKTTDKTTLDEKNENENENEAQDGELDLDLNGGHCFNNLLASWPLIMEFSKTEYGREVLNESFRLCPEHHLQKEQDVFKLMEWAKAPWFPLAEGNYPFASNYITFALLKYAEIKLPKWPITEACRKGELNLHKNVNIVEEIHQGNGNDNGNDNGNGGKADVMFDVVVTDDHEREIITLNIDWDQMTPESFYTKHQLKRAVDSGVGSLFEALREAVGVWYNVTHDKSCFPLDPAISSSFSNETDAHFYQQLGLGARSLRSLQHTQTQTPAPAPDIPDHQSCSAKISQEGSWNSICCNENLNLPIYATQGMGNDFFWPPTAPRGFTLFDLLSQRKENSQDDVFCQDPAGIYGYPSQVDPWSHWIDDYYGGLRIGKHSKIIFSNGLLDPWSGGGVYPGNPPPKGIYEGPTLMNITDDGSVIALMIEKGGHHLDLFYESEDDPESVKEVRRIEDEYISKWIDAWTEEVCVGNVCEVR